MRLLIDTNVLIPGEPTSVADVEPNTRRVTELARLASKEGHQLVVHPAVQADLDRDNEAARRELRRLLAARYVPLRGPPAVPEDWASIIGRPDPGTNDWVDHQLLAALPRNAVHALVTEDRDIHRKAARLGLNDRVFSIADAIAALRALSEAVISPPPAVVSTVAHDLEVRSSFFDSLRADYDGPKFDQWLEDCQKKQRGCWLVRADRELAALCIYKDEEKETYGVQGKVLKLCTFKVDDAHRGRRLGELLLKTAFEHAAKNRHDAMFVTVFPKQEHLLSLFSDFGFEERTTKSNGELVLFKYLNPHLSPSAGSALDFHLRHGPPLLSIEQVKVAVVPIEPRFHHLLFPDAEPQLELTPGAHPFGNGLRKAYLCRANAREIPPGTMLLFYRSDEGRHVRVVGVAERWLRSSKEDEIAAFVGKRTVYPLGEISRMCSKGAVLAVLFRQAVVLDEPISFAELLEQGALRGPPQSLTWIKEKSHPWLRRRLEQSSCFPFGLGTPSPS